VEPSEYSECRCKICDIGRAPGFSSTVSSCRPLWEIFRPPA
jgi:hypothetical protein